MGTGIEQEFEIVRVVAHGSEELSVLPVGRFVSGKDSLRVGVNTFGDADLLVGERLGSGGKKRGSLTRIRFRIGFPIPGIFEFLSLFFQKFEMKREELDVVSGFPFRIEPGKNSKMLRIVGIASDALGESGVRKDVEDVPDALDDVEKGWLFPWRVHSHPDAFVEIEEDLRPHVLLEELEGVHRRGRDFEVHESGKEQYARSEGNTGKEKKSKVSLYDPEMTKV